MENTALIFLRTFINSHLEDHHEIRELEKKNFRDDLVQCFHFGYEESLFQISKVGDPAWLLPQGFYAHCSLDLLVIQDST